MSCDPALPRYTLCRFDAGLSWPAAIIAEGSYLAMEAARRLLCHDNAVDFVYDAEIRCRFLT